MSVPSRATNSNNTILSEERTCHRSQMTSSDAVGRSMALLPINHNHALHHGIKLMPHINMTHREVGATTPLVNNSGTASTCSMSLPGSMSSASDTVCNILPHNTSDGSSIDLASLFECPVCMDYALPPIMQCQSGHIVCASCRSKLSSCPTCRGNLGKLDTSFRYITFNVPSSKGATDTVHNFAHVWVVLCTDDNIFDMKRLVLH